MAQWVDGGESNIHSIIETLRSCVDAGELMETTPLCLEVEACAASRPSLSLRGKNLTHPVSVSRARAYALSLLIMLTRSLVGGYFHFSGDYVCASIALIVSDWLWYQGALISTTRTLCSLQRFWQACNEALGERYAGGRTLPYSIVQLCPW
jgi:hypothetical protein